ncbi:oxidoreductase, partial [candidate division KSB1 bacterium]|nr:oxidoreductase [candidate division KSB1 bacterium]
MLQKYTILYIALILIFLVQSCGNNDKMDFTGADDEVILMTLDPGHFHAALVQKTMYEQISPKVYVYAPEGPDVQDHLDRIESFNNRDENPTNWETVVYKGEDFLEKMLEEKPGNVVILSGNNRKKTDYIKASVDAALNVLSDKPMCINTQGFEKLKLAFDSAEENDVLMYDIMTERYEITTMLQKWLANNPGVFGELQKGT